MGVQGRIQGPERQLTVKGTLLQACIRHGFPRRLDHGGRGIDAVQRSGPFSEDPPKVDIKDAIATADV